MIPTIQELRAPSAARAEAEQRLAEAQTQCEAAAQKLEAAEGAFAKDSSLANAKKRTAAKRDLEPFTDVLAERSKEAKAAVMLEHEAKRAQIPALYQARLVDLQSRALERIAVIAELNAAAAKVFAELDALATGFDRETAELAAVTKDVGGALPAGTQYYWGGVAPRPFNAHDVVHALLPNDERVFGLPLQAFKSSAGNFAAADPIKHHATIRLLELKRLKASLPAAYEQAQAAE